LLIRVEIGHIRIEQPRLVAPTFPACSGFAPKQLKIWTDHKPFDPLPYTIRLSAVLAALFHNEAANILRASDRR
jgi:hypothetical protein